MKIIIYFVLTVITFPCLATPADKKPLTYAEIKALQKKRIPTEAELEALLKKMLTTDPTKLTTKDAEKFLPSQYEKVNPPYVLDMEKYTTYYRYKYNKNNKHHTLYFFGTKEGNITTRLTTNISGKCTDLIKTTNKIHGTIPKTYNLAGALSNTLYMLYKNDTYNVYLKCFEYLLDPTLNNIEIIASSKEELPELKPQTLIKCTGQTKLIGFKMDIPITNDTWLLYIDDNIKTLLDRDRAVLGTVKQFTHNEIIIENSDEKHNIKTTTNLDRLAGTMERIITTPGEDTFSIFKGECAAVSDTSKF